jgi:putative lipoprotein
MRSSVLLLSSALFFMPRLASAEESDPWWGKDKALHFGVSAGLAAGGYGVSSLVLEERWQRATAGAAFSLTLGVGKELWDLSGRGNASWKDLTWDLAGTLVGTGLALVIDLAISGTRSDDEHASAFIRF